MTRIAYVSDIHTEFKSVLPEFPDADVVVFAGDIGSPMNNAVADIGAYKAGLSGDQSLVYIPGNHEYYGGSADQIIPKVSIVRLPEQHMVVVSCTLWTNPPDLDPPRIYDFRAVRGLTHSKMRNVHLAEKEMLADVLAAEAASEPGVRIVVVTHHLPSFLCISPKYNVPGNFQVNRYFASNAMEDIWKTLGPEARQALKLWIFGHTHDKIDMVHPETGVRMVCNPHGYYPDETSDRNPKWAYVEV